MDELTHVREWRSTGGLASVPAAQGVFLIQFAKGRPYLGRTANLRRRLHRLLTRPAAASRVLNLRNVARNVSFARTGSRFESDLALYRTASLHAQIDARELLKLRPPSFVKVLVGNRFPRTCVTQRLTGGRSLFFGPFGSRTAAERFQESFLDLFLLRRCSENLDPSPSHPGCVWGEMNLCLRPCQAACSGERYAKEVEDAVTLLQSKDAAALSAIRRDRDRASEAMEFEAAARHHRRLTSLRETLRLRGDLAQELSALNGMVVQPAAQPGHLALTGMFRGALQPSVQVGWTPEEPTAVHFARELRQLLAGSTWREAKPVVKQDHLALLQRWHRSSFRKGEFVPIADAGNPPIRKLANAARRVALAIEPPPPPRTVQGC